MDHAPPCEHNHLGPCEGEVTLMETLLPHNGDRVAVLVCKAHWEDFAQHDVGDIEVFWESAPEGPPTDDVPDLAGLDLVVASHGGSQVVPSIPRKTVFRVTDVDVPDHLKDYL